MIALRHFFLLFLFLCWLDRSWADSSVYADSEALPPVDPQTEESLEESFKEDSEYWQYFYWLNWKHDRCKFYTVGEFRFNRHISQFYYYRFSGSFAYRAIPWADLEMHYSIIFFKPIGDEDFIHVDRFEFEVNPFLQLGDHVVIQWRNRMEWLKIQNNSHIRSICRHRTMITYSFPEGSRLISIGCSDEFFYDLNICKFIQNRFIPLQLKFALNKDVSIDLFVMFRNFFRISLERWYRSYVIGTQLSF